MSNASNSDASVAVVGATGKQGGATVDALLQAGVAVRALVRDTGSDSARRLARSGASVVAADLDRPDSLVEAFRGSVAVFAMTTFTGASGTDGEVEHGRAIGDAARTAGVSRVVYSSVGGAERRTGIPHFESKRRVEEYLTTLGLETVFLRPTFFMDNFTAFSKPAVQDGTLVVRLPLPAGVPLQMVATRDIGRAAAVALLHPERIAGGAVELGGDEMTGERISAVFGEVQGIPARYEPIPLEALSKDPDQYAMFAWFSRLPAYQADFATSRDLVPDLLDLRAWAAQR